VLAATFVEISSCGGVAALTAADTGWVTLLTSRPAEGSTATADGSRAAQEGSSAAQE